MTTITLQEYLERIETLIDENQFSEAVGHCRNILDTYPRHIDTYRLLAKALLEQHEHEDAADLFQRILSADPNDFISHVGLSIIRSEASQLEQSLWHLERAFEIEPYNAAIQDELRRHYAQFSELAVDRIPLTSGALARLYIKGELYQQAVQELSHALKDEQDRVDLEVLLAEALWRNDQRIDAEEVCLDILQKLPNCIVVNAILSEIWLQTGRIGESQKYLMRLQQLTNIDRANLNLDTAVGRAFYADGAPTLPPEIKLEFKGDYEPAPEAPISVEDGPSADWMSEVTFDSDQGKEFEYGNEPGIVSETESGMHSYDWMAEVNETSDDIPKPETEWFMDDSAAGEEDWLATLDDEEVGETAVDQEFSALFEDEVVDNALTADKGADLDWLQAGEEIQADTSDPNAPGWLTDIIDEPELDTSEVDGEEPSIVPSDWFADVEDDSPVLAQESDDGAADWLTGLVGESDADAVPDITVEGQDAAETLLSDSDWFGEDASSQDWSEEEQALTPDWLRNVAAGEEDEEELIDEEVLEAINETDEEIVINSDVPDWLAEHATDVGGTLTDEPEPANLDEWLSDLAEEEQASSGEEEEGELADWLSEADTASTVESQADATAADDLDGFTNWLMQDDDETSDDDIEEAPDAADELGELTGWLSDSADDAEQIPEEKEPGGLTSWLEGAEEDETEEEGVPSGMLAAAAAATAAAALSDEDDQPEAESDVDEDWLAMLSEAEANLEIDEEALTVADTAVAEDVPPAQAEESFPETGGLDSDWLTAPEEDWIEGFSDGTGDLAEQESDNQFSLQDDVAEDQEEIPDWLMGDEPAGAIEMEGVVSGDKEDKEQELPDDLSSDGFGDPDADWLSELSADADDAEKLPDSEPAFKNEELPDWLAAEAPDPDVVEDLAPESDEDDDLFDLLAEVDDGGDWLSDMQGAVDEPISEAESPLVEEPDAEGSGLTAWLSEAEVDDLESDSSPAEDALDLDAAAAGGLTAWLSESSLADDLDNEAAESLEALDEPSEEIASGLTAWLSDAPDAAGSVDELAADLPVADEIDWGDDESGLTDWLSDMPEDAVEEAVVEDVTAVSQTSSSTTDDLIDDIPEIPSEELFATDEENLPDWLSDKPVDVSDVEEAELPDWLAGVEADSSTDLPPALDSEDLLDSDGLADIGEDLFDDVSLGMDEEDLAPVSEQIFEDESMSAGLTELLADADESSAELDGFESSLDLAWLEDVDEADGDSEAMSMADDVGLDWLTAVEPEAEPEPAAAEPMAELSADQDIELDDAEDVEALEPLDIGQDASEESLDDAMSWLEELASQQETPVDDMPTVAEDLLAAELSELEPAPDTGLEAELSAADILADVEDFDLEEALAEPEDAEEDDASWLDVLISEDEALIEEAEAAAAADLESEEELSEPPEDPEEAMAWLEGLAAKQGAPLEELPSIQDDDFDTAVTASEFGTSEFGDFDADLDDAMTWLQDMQTEADVEEDPELVAALNELEDQLLAEGITPVVKSSKASVSDEELADALDWLEAAAQEPEMAQPEADDVDEVIETEADEEFTLEAEEAEALEVATAVVAEVAKEADEAEDDADLDIFDMPDDPDAAMAWLEQMSSDDGDLDIDMEPPPITPSEDAAFTDIDYGDTVESEAEEEETAVVEEDVEAAVALEADIDVFGEPDLPPETDDDEAIDILDMPDDPDAAMAWLEAMASDEGDIEFDMQPPPITPSEDAAFADIDYGGTTTSEAEETSAEVDPDIEMVEEVTAVVDKVDKIEEETTSEAEAADDIGDFDMFDMPEDPDEAMNWLEQMAAGDGGEIEFDMQPPPITPSEDAAFGDIDYGGASQSEAEVVEESLIPETEEIASLDETAAVPEAEVDPLPDLDDDEDAMAWLEAMAGDGGDIEFDMQPPPITPSEDAAFADIDYGGSSKPDMDDVEAVADVEETEATVESMLEVDDAADDLSADVDALLDLGDDEDAMAWLEAMAGDDGDIEFDMQPPPITPSEDAAFADIDYSGRGTDEVVTAVEESADSDDVLADVPEDPDEAMAWLEKMAAQQTSELSPELGDLPELADTPVPAWLQAAEEEPGIPDISDVTGAEKDAGGLDLFEDALGVDIEDDLSDSLPDWFSMDAQSSPPSGQTGWLRSLEEVDVGSWLEAEEEATGKEVDADVTLPDTGEIVSQAKPGTGPLPSLEPDLPAESPEVARPATESVGQSAIPQLSTARSAVEENRYEDALGEYQQLIASGQGTMALINDLETIAGEHPEQPAFRRLLGDAYMRNGQLQKALNTYRDALDQL